MPQASVLSQTTTNLRTLRMIPVKDIKVGERFRRDLGDIGTFAENMKEIGLLQPPVVTPELNLVAGQRRIEAYKHLKLKEIPVLIERVSNPLLAQYWENSERKDFTMSELIAIKKQVAEMKGGGNLPPLSKKSLPNGKSRDIAAKLGNVSPRTISKAEAVIDAATKRPELKELVSKMDSGRLSVDSAYGQVKRIEKQEELVALAKTRPAPDALKLYNRDFRLGKKAPPYQNEDHWAKIIGRESVDLIFTDPQYDKESVELFGDLARLASVVLKEGGYLCTYTGQMYLDEVMEKLRLSSLHYYWTIAVSHTSNQTQIFPRKVRNRWKPILVFTKTGYVTSSTKSKPKDHEWIFDLLTGEQGDKEAHEWAQGYSEAHYLIDKFTRPADTVLDPMMGSGTTIKAAYDLRRKAIGFEKDETRFNVARGAMAQ